MSDYLGKPEKKMIITSDQVSAFINFLKEGEVMISYNRRWLFPYSIPEEPYTSLEFWDSYDSGIVTLLEWDETTVFCRSLNRLINCLKITLNPKSVWKDGIILEIREQPRTLIRFENITSESNKIRYQKYRLQIKNPDTSICAEYLQLIALKLCRRKDVISLEPWLKCPQCFNQLRRGDDGLLRCDDASHEVLDSIIQEESISCKMRIKKILPHYHTTLEDWMHRIDTIISKGEDDRRAEFDKLSREHEELTMQNKQLLHLIDLMKKQGTNQSDILRIREYWKSAGKEFLKPMCDLLNSYQHALERNLEFIQFKKNDLEEIIHQIPIPEEKKKGIRAKLKDLTGALTIETVGNIIWSIMELVK
jgi:hypothetical protein